MKTCPKPNCKTLVDDEATFCPNCGYDFRTIYECQYCGFQLQYGDNYCKRCGLELHPHNPLPPQTIESAIWSVFSSSIDGCQEYLRRFPSGPHVLEASTIIDDSTWEKLSLSINGCKEYVVRFPSGRHISEANMKIEKHREKRREEVNNFIHGLYILFRHIRG